MVRLCSAVLALSLVACHANRPIVLPEAPEDIRATLFVLAGAAEGPDRVWAFEGGPALIGPFSAPSSGDLVLLMYARSLAELGLEAGEVPLAGVDTAARPLATPKLGLQATRTRAGITGWVPLEADDEWLDRIRLVDRPAEACLAAGGCYLSARDLEARVCSLSCEVRDEPVVPEETVLPAPADFGDCPPGWAVSDEAGVQGCRPGAAQPPTCPAGEAAWPSAGACVSVGPACPGSLGFADDLPSGRPIVYLRRGAEGGDGTRAAPFGIFADALSAAAGIPGAIVAMSEGDYEPKVVPAGVTLWGACTARTRIVGADDFAVRLPGAASGLVNLTVVGPAGGVFIRGDETVLSAVAIEGARTQAALHVDGAEVTATDLRVRGLGEDRMTGVLLQRGAQVSAIRVMLDDNGLDSVRAEDEQTQLVLEDAEVFVGARRNFSDSALYAVRGAKIVGRGVRIAGFRLYGVRTSGAGAQIELQQAVLQGFAEVTERSQAIRIDEGGSADLSRVIVDGVEGSALVVDGGIAVADRLVVGRSLGTQQGLVRLEAGQLALARTDVHTAVGFALKAAHGTLVLRDVTLRDVAMRDSSDIEDRERAVGLWLAAGAVVDGERVAITAVDTHGVVARSDDSDASVTGRLSSLVVKDVRARASASGMGVFFGAGVFGLEIERVVIEDVFDVGLLVAETAQLAVTDARIARSRYGVRVTDASQLELTRASIDSSRGGAVCIRKDTRVSMFDLVVRGVAGLRADESNSVCGAAAMAQGDGVLVNETSQASLVRYEISDCVGAGVRTLGPRVLSARDGLLQRSPVGFDLSPGTDLVDVLLETVFASVSTPLAAPQ